MFKIKREMEQTLSVPYIYYFDTDWAKMHQISRNYSRLKLKNEKLYYVYNNDGSYIQYWIDRNWINRKYIKIKYIYHIK